MKRAGLSLEQELRRMTLGMSFGASKFFVPTPEFIQWMKREAGKTLVYDVGAGAGHVTKALHDAGIATLGIDLYVHDQPEHPVINADGTALGYAKGSIVMICRPCHGNFAEDVVARAIECGAPKVIYVGLVRNVAEDLDEYLLRFKEAGIKAGRDGEKVWVLNG